MIYWYSVELKKNITLILRIPTAHHRKKDLTLNRAKCAFQGTRMEFFGYIFSKDGISADPKKIRAI